MLRKYNSLIIGSGNIGSFYDKPGSDAILTYAHAIKKHAGFNLGGFIDVDREKAKEAASIWGGTVFNDIQEAFSRSDIDVVVNAVPDKYHFDILKKLSSFTIKAIITEKPFATSIQDAEEIINMFKNRNTVIAVNYTRRYIPEFIRLKEEIRSRKYGKYLTGGCIYGKGFLHNGSHHIDLFRFLLGEIDSPKIINKIEDYTPDDPSLSVIVRYDNKPFYITILDSRIYSVFEMELYFEKRKIRIINSGFIIEKYDIKESSVFASYKFPVKTEEVKTDMNNALFHVLENIYNCLAFNKYPLCTIEDASATLKTCIKISKDE